MSPSLELWERWELFHPLLNVQRSGRLESPAMGFALAWGGMLGGTDPQLPARITGLVIHQLRFCSVALLWEH